MISLVAQFKTFLKLFPLKEFPLKQIFQQEFP